MILQGLQEQERLSRATLTAQKSRVEGHLFWHPEADTAAYKTKPHHEVGLLGALEP